MTQTVKVGKDVDSWCTRCKLVLAHTVEAMVGGRITRVHCNTCGAQHAYRPNAPGKKSATARSRSSAGRGQSAAAPRVSEYDTLLQGRDPSTARPYALQERFRRAELLRHSTFGLGIVTADKGENKIEVMFKDGPKTLVHGR